MTQGFEGVIDGGPGRLSLVRTRSNRRARDGSPATSRAKRTVDVGIAAVLLLVLLPLLILLAAAIKLESRGPVLFRQRRTGLNGRIFFIRKFRTMRVLEDGDHIRHASRGDKRVTRLGAVLRRTSLDELPQLLNVLRGDMSLVGPRPHAVAHDAHYAELLPDYHLRFRTRPGVTGLAQISGWRGEVHRLECMAGRVRADNAYVDAWSLRLDLIVIARTLRHVWESDQAY